MSDIQIAVKGIGEAIRDLGVITISIYFLANQLLSEKMSRGNVAPTKAALYGRISSFLEKKKGIFLMVASILILFGFVMIIISYCIG